MQKWLKPNDAKGLKMQQGEIKKGEFFLKSRRK